MHYCGRLCYWFQFFTSSSNYALCSFSHKRGDAALSHEICFGQSNEAEMTVCLCITKPRMFLSAVLCFCHYHEKNVSGLPLEGSGRHRTELPQLICPGQAQPQAKPHPILRHMIKRTHDQQYSSWPTVSWATIIHVVVSHWA